MVERAGNLWLEILDLNANPATYEWFDVGQVSQSLFFIICKRRIITCSFQAIGRMKRDNTCEYIWHLVGLNKH